MAGAAQWNHGGWRQVRTGSHEPGEPSSPGGSAGGAALCQPIHARSRRARRPGSGECQSAASGA
eukprot:2512846-Prorocentrum_lima.AAC.1